MKILKGLILLVFVGVLSISCKKEKKAEEHSVEENIEVIEEQTESSETHSHKERSDHTNHKESKKESANEHSNSKEVNTTEEIHEVEEIKSKSADVTSIATEEKEPRLSVKTVEQPPVFPDCEGSSDQLIECFNKKVVEFVDKNYNSIVSAEDGITDDNYRIVVQFDVNTKGEIVDVHAQGPNKETSDEAVRVIKLLPKMQPATHNGKPVRVVYTVPIKLKVRT